MFSNSFTRERFPVRHLCQEYRRMEAPFDTL